MPVRVSPRVETKDHSGNRDCHDQISSRAACDISAFDDAIHKLRNACTERARESGAGAGRNREGKKRSAEGSPETSRAAKAAGSRAAQIRRPTATATSGGATTCSSLAPDGAASATASSDSGANSRCAATAAASGRGTKSPSCGDAITRNTNTFGNAASPPRDLARSGDCLARRTEAGCACPRPDALCAASRPRLANASAATGWNPARGRLQQPGRATAKCRDLHASRSTHGDRADSGATAANGAGSDTDSTGCAASGATAPGRLPRRTARGPGRRPHRHHRTRPHHHPRSQRNCIRPS